MASPLLISPFPNAYYPFTEGAMYPTALSQFSDQAIYPSAIVIAYSDVLASNDFSSTSDVSVSSQTNSPPHIQPLITHPMITRTKDNTRQPKQFRDFVTTHYHVNLLHIARLPTLSLPISFELIRTQNGELPWNMSLMCPCIMALVT